MGVFPMCRRVRRTFAASTNTPIRSRHDNIHHSQHRRRGARAGTAARVAAAGSLWPHAAPTSRLGERNDTLRRAARSRTRHEMSRRIGSTRCSRQPASRMSRPPRPPATAARSTRSDASRIRPRAAWACTTSTRICSTPRSIRPSRRRSSTSWASTASRSVSSPTSTSSRSTRGRQASRRGCSGWSSTATPRCRCGCSTPGCGRTTLAGSSRTGTRRCVCARPASRSSVSICPSRPSDS